VVHCTLYLIDETVEVPIKCLLNITALNGEISVGNIIRIHKIQSKMYDGVAILSGTVGAASLHIVGLSSTINSGTDSEFRSTEVFKLNADGPARVEQLREFWASIKPHAVLMHGDLSSHLTDDADRDLFSSAQRQQKTVSIRAPAYEGDVAAEIRSKILNLKQTRKVTQVTDLQHLTVTRAGNFDNILCEIISILKTKEGEPAMYYLRVCDGTCSKFRSEKRILRLEDSKIDEAHSKMNVELEEKLHQCTADIACYDVFATQAESCQPGDVIKITNMRIVEKESVIVLNLGGGKGNQTEIIARFSRGITLIQSVKEKENARPNHGGSMIDPNEGADGAASPKRSRLDDSTIDQD